MNAQLSTNGVELLCKVIAEGRDIYEMDCPKSRTLDAAVEEITDLLKGMASEDADVRESSYRVLDHYLTPQVVALVFNGAIDGALEEYIDEDANDALANARNCVESLRVRVHPPSECIKELTDILYDEMVKYYHV